jgi:hypothetical protein
VSLGGFDTHSNERATQQRLLTELDKAVAGFLSRIAADPRGDDVVVAVYSEFGRRVAANGSDGTDHGTAGPVLVAGAPVRGGFYGEQPSLTDLDHGDLKPTTDFRDVYAALLAGVLGAEPGRVLDGTTPGCYCSRGDCGLSRRLHHLDLRAANAPGGLVQHTSARLRHVEHVGFGPRKQIGQAAVGPQRCQRTAVAAEDHGVHCGQQWDQYTCGRVRGRMQRDAGLAIAASSEPAGRRAAGTMPGVHRAPARGRDQHLAVMRHADAVTAQPYQ